MKQVRVTTLEQFRRVIETEYAPAKELIEYIVAGQTSPGNERMNAGTEWHGLLQDPPIGANTRFRDRDVRAAQLMIRALGSALNETELRGEIGGLEVVGHVDHWIGGIMTDHKLTFSPADPENYDNSLQWRLYMHLGGTDVFRYIVWQFKESDELPYQLVKSEAFRYWRYGALQADCERWATSFRMWANAMDLTKYLPDATGNSPSLV